MRKFYLRTFIIISLWLFWNGLRAELINGPANIRVKPDQAVLISLYDNVEVDCTVQANGWFQVGISVKISKLQYNKQMPLKKGDQLIDLKGRLIGEVLSDIPPGSCYTFTYGGASGVPEVFGLNIYGYTHKANIRENSILENPLTDLLESKATGFTIEDFMPLIKQFSFRKEGLLKRFYPALTEYIVYENAIEDPSPIDRIRLIFERNTLVAIIHSRHLNVKNTENITLVRDLKLLIFQLPRGVDKKSFIQKNKDSYDGVD